MSTGLGGWQRLGIVVSTGWTLFVAFIVWNNGPVLSDFTPLYWLPDQPAEVLARFDSQRSQIISFGLLLWLMPPLAIGVVCRWVYQGFRLNVEKDPLVDQASSAAGCSEVRRVPAKRCPSCGLLNHGAAEHCALCDNFASGSVEEIQFEFTGQGRDAIAPAAPVEAPTEIGRKVK